MVVKLRTTIILTFQAMATSDSSIEVWWEAVPLRTRVIGYEIFYSMTDGEDLTKWQRKTVGLTTSAELVNLERDIPYAIRVAARTNEGLGRLSQKIIVEVKPRNVVLNLRAKEVSTHTMELSWSPPIDLTPINYKISYNAYKEFVDAQGGTQSAHIPTITILVSPKTNSYKINDLSPFTTYHVNVSAIPQDRSYRPPAKITVTTQMAAPQPMVRPDFYGVRKQNQGEISVFLPRASEEYGPISHYYVIVIPNSNSSNVRYPDQYSTEDLVAYSKSTINDDNEDFEDRPYIAAKFLQQSIKYRFILGDGLNYEGFINRKLKADTYYKVFVRAYVDVPQKHLYTSSPFSPELNLNMMQEPPGPPPERPKPNGGTFGAGPNGRPKHKQGSMVWIVGPVLAFILFAFLIILICVLRKRRQNVKQPLEQGAVMTPLMSGFEMNNAQVVNNAGNHHANGNNGTMDMAPVMMDVGPGVSDPVELRRLNFQTPGRN